MAYINDKKEIFFVTSPRSPFKMINEIDLLIKFFNGKKWNKNTQTQFARKLSESEFFEGKIISNFDFAARDRINRAPKSLGFVNIKPTIQLTNAGKVFLKSKRPNEIFTRQILKLQLPSFYHIDKNNKFAVKPYLELLRLVYELNGITKNEIAIFVMQLINIEKYEKIKSKILDFREDLKKIDRRKTSSKQFINTIFTLELRNIYEEEIISGNTKTRESNDKTLRNFINTKKRNNLDYADAAIRYLRFTKLVTINTRKNKIFIPEEKIKDVEFILSNVYRNPEKFININEFKSYLYNPSEPVLLGDNKNYLINYILNLNPSLFETELNKNDIEYLKDIRDLLISERNEKIITEEFNILKTYDKYSDIVFTFDNILNRDVLEPSLIMEWNTWRAFAMLDYGKINGMFIYDDNGMPLNNAPGNCPDIICEYKNFDIIVEVTLSTGQRQYEMEGEPVARHLGNYKKEVRKETFCIFIAPKLNKATIAHFFVLNNTKISYYGGKSKIIPISLKDFLIILEKAYKASSKPKAENLKEFLENCCKIAFKSENEEDWYNGINNYIGNWIQ